MTLFHRRFHRHGSHLQAFIARRRVERVRRDHASVWRRWSIILLLVPILADAQARMEPTTRNTLEVPGSVDEELVTQWREAIDAYREELRQGQQLATRPLTQQSAEVAILNDHLRSAGYYNADIQTRPTEDYDDLRYRVNPGRRFTVRQIVWDWPDSLSTPLISQVNIRNGQPLVAQDILDVRDQLRREIQTTACYLRVNVGYELRLDRSAHAGDIRFYMEPSPQVTLGEISVTGTETVRSSYAKRLTQLEAGDCFQRPRLDQARLNLYESNLFARVDEQLSAPDENNQVDVRYVVQERNHRTLSLGAGVDTDVGVGVNAEWTHRNFSGRGERVVLGTQWSLLTQGVSASLTIPRRNPRRPIITVSTRFERSTFGGHPVLLWQNGINLEQNLWSDWVGNLGIDLRSSWSQVEGETTDFEQWLALPTSVTRDTRDDLLDPRDGTRLLIGFTPNYSLSGTQPAYSNLRTAGRAYWTLGENFTLAVASEFTTLLGLGEELDLGLLAPTERLYAGGGGSVRGWLFQSVPPTEGGRLRWVNSIEQRVRIGESWGTVAFVDGAWLSPDYNLDWDNGALGLGLGVRYFTDFAPLRADIATPLTDEIGTVWRFYFSIGQAF